MRVIEHKGKIVLEMDSGVETVTDTLTGFAKHFVHLPALETIPSTVLEDIFHAVNCELMMRDKRYIQESF